MQLQPGHFRQFYKAIHGRYPFPWQERLAQYLAETNTWPEVLALPTGSGKTSAMDVAVFHLALRANTPRAAFLRIVFVVDRRLVVDEAFARAKKLERKLRKSLSTHEERITDPVIREVASRLAHLAGGDTVFPLVAARLRGGAPLEHVWARSPSQPTVLCSTVDQVGSRLLFRGYGVTDRMKPIHAGLLGDSLILLDEAHLSEPFRQTLDAVRDIGRASVRTVLLTATPEPHEATELASEQTGSGTVTEKVFRLSEADHEHPILKSRIETSKVARLTVIRHRNPECGFGREAKEIMERLQDRKRAPVVGVVVNRVALARTIHRHLAKDGENVLLMIGRSRGVDRDAVAERLAPFMMGASDRNSNESQPTFVVATQCLEVGVDLDLDGLVTQAAPLDALRQRFGRLRRSGNGSNSEFVPAAILALPEDISANADDPVYGDRIRLTWEWMDSHSTGPNKQLDFGIQAMDSLVDRNTAVVADLATERAEAPVLMPAYLDFWAQTWPIPRIEPEIGLFLHGAERGSIDVSIVWRDDITKDSIEATKSKEHLTNLMNLVPPRAAEMLQVPLHQVRQWLSRSDVDQLSDIPQRTPQQRLHGPELHAHTRSVFRWAGRDSDRTGVIQPNKLFPGDIIVVPADYGGCDRFGWEPKSGSPVHDVADRAAQPYSTRRFAVRLNEARCGPCWSALKPVLASHAGTFDRDLLDRLMDALAVANSTENADNDRAVQMMEQAQQLKRLAGARSGRVQISTPYGSGRQVENGVVLLAPKGVTDSDIARDELASIPPATESRSFSQDYGRPVKLDQHCIAVEKQVARTAQLLQMPVEVAADLKLAGYLHDAGKADRRFQILLSGGSSWNAANFGNGEQVLAKSGRPYTRSNSKHAGLPRKWRHEALSVRLAQLHPRFREATDQELVIWLIGTHHGFGRPFFPAVKEVPDEPPQPALDVASWPDRRPGPDSPQFDLSGQDWPQLYRTLKSRYGTWQLAALEAIVRLADHQVSAQESHSGSEWNT